MKIHDLMARVRMRSCLAAICAVIVGAAVSSAQAETYPSRPITIITSFAAGGVTDATTRVLAKFMQEQLGQTVIVENKSGAGGMIAATAVARAKPDGYTLLMTTNSTHSAAPGLFKIVPYDPIKDFTPIARVGSFPLRCRHQSRCAAPFDG